MRVRPPIAPGWCAPHEHTTTAGIVMPEHSLTFPATEEAIRELRAGDSVLVDGHIIGIRDRTHPHLRPGRRAARWT